MAQLTVGGVDDDLVRRLNLRAGANGRSAEAEHRAILEAALRPGADDFWERVAEVRERLGGRDLGDSDDEILRALGSERPAA